MSTHPAIARLRTRWSAIGAAVAVSLGAGGIGLANAAIDSGDKPVTVTVDSKRILDTRTNLGLAGRFADATPRDLQVTGDVAVAPSGTETVVPAGATAVLVNVTVVFPSDPGFLALRSGDATGVPSTSTVNFFPGSVEPNAATVDLSTDGKVEVWVEMSSDSGNAHVLVDVVGYTIDHTHDDRYYTEGEVDAAVEAALSTKADAADTIWAVVQSDGTISRSNDPGTSATVDGIGNYLLTTSRDLSQCAYIATLGSDVVGTGPDEGEITVRPENSSVNNVYVQTNDSSGTAEAAPFHIAVHC